MFSGASNARDTPNISKNMIYILSAQLINEGMSLQRERESSPEVLVIGETETSEAKLIPAT
jgi:hypothetical protein